MLRLSWNELLHCAFPYYDGLPAFETAETNLPISCCARCFATAMQKNIEHNKLEELIVIQLLKG